MKYVGGKSKIGWEIASTMRHSVPNTNISYLEPFCGALGVFQHMSKYGYKKYIGSDLQPDMIRLWKAVKNGRFRLPSSVSKEQYATICSSKTPSARRAAIAYGLGFRGRFSKGFDNTYSAYRALKNDLQRKTTLLKHNPKIHFVNKDYKSWRPSGMLIYCDPPYKVSNRSKNIYFPNIPAFDHDQFWDIMRKWSKKNYVFVSELEAPKDFKSIWSKKVPTLIATRDRKNYRRERLFVLRDSPADRLPSRRHNK